LEFPNPNHHLLLPHYHPMSLKNHLNLQFHLSHLVPMSLRFLKNHLYLRFRLFP
jgi:hypothetical protein